MGDKVRIAIQKLPFAKGYERTSTEELFQIQRIGSGRVIIYRLVDKSLKKVFGEFYEYELVVAQKEWITSVFL